MLPRTTTTASPIASQVRACGGSASAVAWPGSGHHRQGPPNAAGAREPFSTPQANVTAADPAGTPAWADEELRAVASTTA